MGKLQASGKNSTSLTTPKSVVGLEGVVWIKKSSGRRKASGCIHQGKKGDSRERACRGGGNTNVVRTENPRLKRKIKKIYSISGLGDLTKWAVGGREKLALTEKKMG